MPQIWLTYEEAGDLFGCDASTARDRAIASGYARRKCSDGQTRIKLSLSAAHDYMMAYANRPESQMLPAHPAVPRERDRTLN
ncbi:hypothetical protein GCM10007276_27660 [Agaricicola taiwanensis]|uniref:Uncharacterized protein n=1 Tax=Agaricicola taiwanensis TaxID=591372 RepID=A0A8J3DZU0_9RHOB|nr:hypothetical protein [Agaricicola taiwanensis]GGE49011.1 hypothetical protein GCM10007276_27660 [Agaricicola taiwanensis]